MACVAGARAAVAAMCLLCLPVGEAWAQVPDQLKRFLGGDPELQKLKEGQQNALKEIDDIYKKGKERKYCWGIVGPRDQLTDIRTNRNHPFWKRHGLADASTTVLMPVGQRLEQAERELTQLLEECQRKQQAAVPGTGGPTTQPRGTGVSVSIQPTVGSTNPPQVGGGTAVGPGGEKEITKSANRPSSSGVEANVSIWPRREDKEQGVGPFEEGVELFVRLLEVNFPILRFGLFGPIPPSDLRPPENKQRFAPEPPAAQRIPQPFRDMESRESKSPLRLEGRTSARIRYTEFDDSANGAVPVGGTPVAFTYLAPNPVNGSTGVFVGPSGQSVTIHTRGHIVDAEVGPTIRVVCQDPRRCEWPLAGASATVQPWREVGLGLFYRNMKTEHEITQQSLLFPINSQINLDINSHFVGPMLRIGAGFEPAGSSGPFGGVNVFAVPGLLHTRATARQVSNCVGCPAPEVAWSQEHHFNNTSFAALIGVEAQVGYQINNRIRAQLGAGATYMNRTDFLRNPISPLEQPVALHHDSSHQVWAKAGVTIALP